MKLRRSVGAARGRGRANRRGFGDIDDDVCAPRRQQRVEQLSRGGRCAYRDAEMPHEPEEGIAIELEQSVSGCGHGERGQRDRRGE